MRRRFFAIFALVGAFGLFLSSVASADPVTRSVSGTLVNSCSDTGDPVGIWMVVWDGSTQISSATVGVGGAYTITNVPPGNYNGQSILAGWMRIRTRQDGGRSDDVRRDRDRLRVGEGVQHRRNCHWVSGCRRGRGV